MLGPSLANYNLKSVAFIFLDNTIQKAFAFNKEEQNGLRTVR